MIDPCLCYEHGATVPQDLSSLCTTMVLTVVGHTVPHPNARGASLAVLHLRHHLVPPCGPLASPACRPLLWSSSQAVRLSVYLSGTSSTELIHL